MERFKVEHWLLGADRMLDDAASRQSFLRVRLPGLHGQAPA